MPLEPRFAVEAFAFELSGSPDRYGPGVHSVQVRAHDRTYLGHWRMDVGFEGSSIPKWVQPIIVGRCREYAELMRQEVLAS